MKFFGLFMIKLIRNLLRPLSFLPAIVIMYLIFSFSSQNGAVSGGLSYKVSRGIVTLADQVMDYGFDETQIGQQIENIHYYVRKAAHITEYFLLAVSVAFPLYVYRLRGFRLVLVAGLFCVAFAGLDEYRQSFVPGRGPSVKDVLIDSIGILTGIYFTRMMGYIGRKTIFRPLSLRPNED